jgi:hypothetical protein
MTERVITIVVALAAIGLGVDTILTERGSHIFGRIGPHYEGTAAIVEGVVFILVGIVLLFRVWAKRSQSS